MIALKDIKVLIYHHDDCQSWENNAMRDRSQTVVCAYAYAFASVYSNTKFTF